MSPFRLNDVLSEEDLAGAGPEALESGGSGVAQLAADVCARLQEELASLGGSVSCERDVRALQSAMQAIEQGSSGADPRWLSALHDLLGCLGEAGAPGFAASIEAWVAELPARVSR